MSQISAVRTFGLAWLSWRMVAGVAIAVVVVAALAVGAWFWLDAQARRAEAAYAGALAKLAPRSGPDTPKGPEQQAAGQDLEAVLAQYPSASMAPLAAYELGNLRYGERDFARARGAYELALARAGSPTVRVLARAGLGYAWEAERNAAKATEAFQAALAEVKPGEFMYDELLLDLARVQAAADRKDDAISTYRRFLKELPRSPRIDEAKGRLARLGATP
jgi:tetratricopeptide (TPR) repeat protein